MQNCPIGTLFLFFCFMDILIYVPRARGANLPYYYFRCIVHCFVLYFDFLIMQFAAPSVKTGRFFYDAVLRNWLTMPLILLFSVL